MLYVIVGITYAVAAPPLEVSDEPRHYAMVEWLAQGRGLPVQRIGQGDADAPYGQEGSQPPLYYAVMALVAQPFDRSDYAQVWRFNPHTQSMGRADATANRAQLLHTPDQVFPWHGTVLAVMVMRLLGVLMGGVTVVCAWVLAREMVGEGRRLVDGFDEAQPMTPVVRRPSSVLLLAAALTAFNPMFLHIMGSVNNDTLATMLSALALALGARMIRRGATPSQSLWLGIILGGAALTKASGLALVGVVPLFVAFSDWAKRKEAGPKHAVRSTLIALLCMWIPAALIAGWWYVRNGLLYGDPTGTAMMAQIAGPRVPPLTSVFELAAEWRSFFTAYWGMFGALNIPMSDWVYPAFEGLWGIASVGLIWVVIRRLRALAATWNRAEGLLGLVRAPDVLIGLMAFAAVAVAFLALLRWSSLTLASQGRLLFPVITAISTFTAMGWTQVVNGLSNIIGTLGRHSSSVVRRLSLAVNGLLIIALAALAVAAPWAYIAPAYARPRLLRDEAQLPPALVRTELTFANQIRWIGYVAEPARVHPGELMDVTLYWQALQPITTDYSLGLRLFGRGRANDGATNLTTSLFTDTEWLVLDTYPGGGMWPTTLWQPGQIVADHYRLRIPATPTVTALLPSVVKLDVGFYTLNGFQFITDTRDAQGQPSGRQRYVIASAGAAGMPANSSAGRMLLSQARVLSATARVENEGQGRRQGRRIRLTTRWQATENITEDYTMFVQLWPRDIASVAAPLAQADGPVEPLPVRWWRAGDVVEDVRDIALPDGLPPGAYIIQFGLYRPVEPYERMPAFGADGAELPNRALQVEVQVD